MQTPSQTTHIRECVRQTFFAMGVRPDVDLHETVLIRDGFYCGHRFKMQDLQAVWFIEEDELKIYGSDGRVAQMLRPSELSTPVAKAA